LWWAGSGRNPEGREKAGFSNIFHGTIDGNVITGSWADDPRGQARNAGKLSLEIIGVGRTLELRKTSQTGGFGGGVWKPLK
jgi:hypothetical protein